MKLKLCFFLFVSLIIFFILSLIISSSYMEISEDTEFFQLSESVKKPQKGTLLHRFRQKLKRVKRANLSKLRQSRNCRFQCQPAIESFKSNLASGVTDKDSYQTVMISHCLHCLRRKGFMEKIIYGREIKTKMLATPFHSTPEGDRNYKTENIHQPNHLMFGGWISKALDSVNSKSSSHGKQNMRKLLSEDQKNFKKAFKVSEETIVLDEKEDDYINNYSDISDEEGVPDLENLEEKTKDWITKILKYALIFFGIVFVILVPVFSFLDAYSIGISDCCLMSIYIFCCRDPKYVLMKRKCKEDEIPVPTYKHFKDIVRRYNEKKEPFKEENDVYVDLLDEYTTASSSSLSSDQSGQYLSTTSFSVSSDQETNESEKYNVNTTNTLN